jgi:uncharacterized protein YndB with AHSA1/START domain
MVDEGEAMESDGYQPVSVSRRINAPAGDIFTILTDPARHPAFDGSGMLRPGAGAQVVAGVGDTFVMKMHLSSIGDYEMHNRVVAYETDRSIGWEPGNGSRWRFDLTPESPDATVVTETYDCSGCSEEVRQTVDEGKAWIDGMTKTLGQLEQLCAGQQ